MIGSATFSSCGRYRYVLTREDGSRRIVFVMLNPATADADRDDRTIAQCRKYAARFARARRWSHHVVIVNLYGFRTPSPRALFLADDPIGPDNDRHLHAAIDSADLLICAWGRHGKRADSLLPLRGAHRLGRLNGDGSPRHPCRLPDRVPLLRW